MTPNIGLQRTSPCGLAAEAGSFGGAFSVFLATLVALAVMFVSGCETSNQATQASSHDIALSMPEECPRQTLPADIQPPKMLSQVSPDPRDGQGNFHYGLVCAEGTLSVDGHVKDLKITRHGDAVLERALKVAVAQWRYLPAIKDGQPVEVPISFSVDSRKKH